MFQQAQALILAAGEGSRFRQAGYLLPKPFLPINGTTFLARVQQDLSRTFSPSMTRVALRKEVSHLWAYETEVVCVPALTGGAAETALLAESYFASELPLVIANSDQVFSVSPAQRAAIKAALADDTNVILTMPAPTDPKDVKRWSYAVTNDEGLVVDVIEKPLTAPSRHATVGIYAFSKARHAFDAIRAMRAANFRVNGEFYLAPCFGYVKNPTIAVRVQSFHGLGTPEDYEAFLKAEGKEGAKDG